MSRKMLSIPVLVSFVVLVAGSVEASPLNLPQDGAGPVGERAFQELRVRKGGRLAPVFQKDGLAADANGLKATVRPPVPNWWRESSQGLAAPGQGQ